MLPLFHLKSVSPFHLISLLFALALALALAVAFLMKLCILNNSRKSNTRIIGNVKYNLPPGPEPWPIVGNLPEMLISRQPKFLWIHSLMNKYNTDIASIRLGNVHIIPVRSPEIASEFLRKHDSVFRSRPLNMTTDYSSRGYLTTAVVPEGAQWKKMRRLVSAHILNPAKLHCLREKRDQEADNLVRFIYNQCKSHSSVVNVRFAIWHYCGNVIRKMMFSRRYFGQGRKDGGPGFEEQELMTSTFKVVAHLYSLSPSDYNSFWRLLDLDGHGKIVKESMRTITKYQDPIIEQRMDLWRDGKKTEGEDMLDLFILSKDLTGRHLSTEEIKAQCAELAIAAVDNPSNVVEWALAEMINNPEILHKATEEIDRIVGNKRLVQEFDIPSLRYISACARETFRLHPIAPFLPPHVSTADVIVSGNFIPEGSHVLLSRVDLGRNPRVWEDPLTFEPSRHLRDVNANVEIREPELRFISFGAGRRECPAISLGSTMTMMLLARLLQAFSWGFPPGKKIIDLVESRCCLLLLDQPLHALANPRLPTSLYLGTDSEYLLSRDKL